MNHQPILFVDFDRTLFDTPQFMKELWKAIGELHKIDAHVALQQVEDFYVPVGDSKTYDFYGHLQKATGLSDREKNTQKLYQALESKDFLYDDAERIFEWQDKGYDVRILTFGEDPWQLFKLSLAPTLQNIPAEIVLEQKRDYISRMYPEASGWLVDDKPDLQLPFGFTEITLDRKAAEPIQRKDGTIIVNSLNHVLEVL